MSGAIQVSTNELVDLCAVDDQLYCKTFFPRTFRQGFPSFWDKETKILESPEHRYVGLKRFRGSAKTTRFRAFASKRIAYAISNTIMFVCNSQKHAGFSLKWLRKQVDYNTYWASTFSLKPGPTWNDEHLEIVHGVDGRIIHVLAFGITGQIRGVNLDDFRPDLILLDDIDNEETTNTPDQREKTSDLVFGALQKSLAPPTENPTAKMAIGQTPFNGFDTITQCEKSPEWHVSTESCFDSMGQSTWPQRYPTTFLLKEKLEHMRMNKAALWMREMECKIISPETASFEVSWLKYWDAEQTASPKPGSPVVVREKGLPPGLVKFIAIDPASSDSKDADDQVIGVVGFRGQDIYLVEYTAEKGEMPEAAAMTFISYLIRHAIHRAVCESVAYQKILAWYIEKKMREQKRWVVIDQVVDRRKKSDRIIQALRDKAANGHLWVSIKHEKFIQQFTEYRPGVDMHDDVLDMVAMAVTSHKGYTDENVYEGEAEVIDESNIPALKLEVEACP